MKVPQHTENKPRGRPRQADLGQLLLYEGAWVQVFCGLRDGAPETDVDTHGTSGVFIRASGQGREKVQVTFPGQAPYVVRQPKFTRTPNEIRNWRSRVREEEEKFRRVTMGDEPTKKRILAIPAERHLWEALKRAQAAAQVRRTYSRSKIWFKSRVNFPGGGYVDWSWSPLPRALYDHAEEFCRAKLHSRYPSRDQRKSGDYRRIEYLARVMAGLSLMKPIAPSYSIELLRKLKHSEKCRCWRCTAKIAPRYRRSLAQFLIEQLYSAQD